MNAKLKNPPPLQAGSSTSPFIFQSPGHLGVVHDAKASRISLWGLSEDTYWREQYRNEPYFDRIYGYADYLPAFRMGCESYAAESSFEAVESLLEARWNAVRDNSRLSWYQARAAVRAGWFRVKWIGRFRAVEDQQTA